MKTWRAKRQEIHDKLGAERSEVLEITAQLINLIHSGLGVGGCDRLPEGGLLRPFLGFLSAA